MASAKASRARKAKNSMSRPKQSTLVIPLGDDPGGNTPFERFDNIMKRLLSASKKDVDRRMTEFAAQKKKPKRQLIERSEKKKGDHSSAKD